MKTEVVMKRKFLDEIIQQRSHSELFCANDIIAIGNKFRLKEGLALKQLSFYFNLDETQELIEQIKWEFGLQEEEIKKVTKGRNGGTWIHPLLFIDMAMWISPEFKVKVLKWVMDGLLEHRDNSGDSFKLMNKTLTEKYKITNPTIYIKLANHIAKSCGVSHLGKDKWQLATEEQLKLRDKIQNRITIYADVVDDLTDCVNKAVNKELEIIDQSK